MNRQAVTLAKEAAAESDGEPPLVAGNICNTNLYAPDDREADSVIRAMFEEQVGWAADMGVDLIIAETISYPGEAHIALDVIKQTGLPSVITLALHRGETLRGGNTVEDACKRLEDAGADVVGLNCARGPATLLPYVQRIRAAVSCHVAALPVPYRTTPAEPTMQSLRDPACTSIPDDRPFPIALDPFTCNRFEVAEFTRAAYDAGVHYLGLCCGNAPHLTRQMAETLGRRPPASTYSADMTKHFAFGTDASLKAENREFSGKL